MESKEATARIVICAKKILDGDHDPVAMVRIICNLRHSAGLSNDKDFHPFLNIDSDTLHVPLGEVRN